MKTGAVACMGNHGMANHGSLGECEIGRRVPRPPKKRAGALPYTTRRFPDEIPCIMGAAHNARFVRRPAHELRLLQRQEETRTHPFL